MRKPGEESPSAGSTGCSKIKKRFRSYRDQLTDRSQLVPNYTPTVRTFDQLDALAGKLAKQHAQGGCSELEAHQIQDTAMHQLGRDRKHTLRELEEFLQRPPVKVNYHMRLRIATWLAIAVCATIASTMGFADKVEINVNGTLDIDDSVSSILRIAFFAVMAWALSTLKKVARTATARSFPDKLHVMHVSDPESQTAIPWRVGIRDDNLQTIRENAMEWVRLKHADQFSEHVKTAVDTRIKTMYAHRAEVGPYERRRAIEFYYSMMFSNLLATKVLQTVLSAGMTFGVSRAVETAASQMESVAGYRAVNFFAQAAFISLVLLSYGQLVVQLGAGSVGMAFGSMVYAAMRCASQCGMRRVLGFSEDMRSSLMASDAMPPLDRSLDDSGESSPRRLVQRSNSMANSEEAVDAVGQPGRLDRRSTSASVRVDMRTPQHTPDGDRPGTLILPARPGAGLFDTGSPNHRPTDDSLDASTSANTEGSRLSEEQLRAVL